MLLGSESNVDLRRFSHKRLSTLSEAQSNPCLDVVKTKHLPRSYLTPIQDAEMKKPKTHKMMAAWRIDSRLLKRLKAFAKRKRTTQTALLEKWIDQKCILKKQEN